MVKRYDFLMLLKGEKDKKGYGRRLIEITGSAVVVPRVVEPTRKPVPRPSATALISVIGDLDT